MLPDKLTLAAGSSPAVDPSPTNSHNMSAVTSDRVQHLPIGHVDILDAIVHICQAEKAYRTISLFALISKHHHRTIQPRLTRIKARVVLDLDDYEWRNKDNDINIE